jgi:uncharacterized protein (TIGR02611 family)
VVVAVIGGTLLLIGGVMLVTPGPAMVVIPLGLAVLAAEFAWARRLLRRVKAQVRRQFQRDRPESPTRREGGEAESNGVEVDRELNRRRVNKP